MSGAARSTIAAFLVVLVGCGSRLSGPQPGADITAAESTITASGLAETIRFLSSDDLEGRAPGTRGDRLARQYLIAEMQRIGLQPGAADGSWEQTFTLLGVRSHAPQQWTFTHAGQRTSIAASDFVAVGGRFDPRVAIRDSELVFVGYGIEAPEYQWDDFKGADVRGKTLLMLNNDPDWDPNLFAGKRRLYYGRWTYKYENAARHGAAAAIVIHTDESASYPWHTVQTSWSGENSHLPVTGTDTVAIEAWLPAAAVQRVVALSGHNLDQLTAAAHERSFVPVPLGVRTSLAVRNETRRYETANVLGLITGRDASEQNNLVVLTAHHDHLGSEDKDGQHVIYNGALDNAAGVAQLLQIAGAFRALPQPPRRSVLFAAVGAEEQGLLGSAYYAAHPTVAAGRIMANLNFDGGNIWGRTRDIASIGYGKSTLDRYATAAAAAQHRVYVDEPFPEKGAFYRSDQFNFAKIGVPALFLHEGTDFIGRPPGWGKEQIEAWIAQHYHQPSDDFDPTWPLDGMVEDARLGFRVAEMIADTSDVPAWVPGDEFAAVREQARRAVQ